MIGEQDSGPVDPLAVWWETPLAGAADPIDSRDARGLKRIDVFRSAHDGGAHFLMVDGAVRWISAQIDLNAYHALATIADGEPVSDF
jgi:prepilin-type processing-associated H-X9-DG protein